MAGAEPLWRAIAVYRFASIGYAALLVVINRADYSRPVYDDQQRGVADAGEPVDRDRPPEWFGTRHALIVPASVAG